jgi:hypothetical protein
MNYIDFFHKLVEDSQTKPIELSPRQKIEYIMFRLLQIRKRG